MLPKRSAYKLPGRHHAGTDSPRLPSPLPKLISFDLDATLWWPEVYMMTGPPFTRRAEDNSVLDSSGEAMELYPGVVPVLRELATDPRWRAAGVAVAYASRTDCPDWAHDCLRKLHVTGVDSEAGSGTMTLHELGKFQQIYPGDKKTHHRRLGEDAGVAPKDMLFFDNERRNCSSVAKLGVTCVWTPEGLTMDAFRRGLDDFAAARGGTRVSEKAAAKGKQSKRRSRW